MYEKNIPISAVDYISVYCSKNDIPKNLDVLVQQVQAKVINWRRDIHQNPELSNREFNTSKKVAAHLKAWG